jgi:lysozyme
MEKRTSALARLFAALALIAAVLAVVVVLSATNGDDSSDGRAHERTSQTKQQSSGKKRTKATTYTVESGDTLTSIAHTTGVPVPELLALNPEVDPQILIAGQTLKLR